MKSGFWWLDWLQLASAILIPVVVLPLMRSLRQVRQNELKHIERAMERIEELVHASERHEDERHGRLHRRIDDLQEQINVHFRWHAEHPRP